MEESGVSRRSAGPGRGCAAHVFAWGTVRSVASSRIGSTWPRLLPQAPTGAQKQFRRRRSPEKRVWAFAEPRKLDSSSGRCPSGSRHPVCLPQRPRARDRHRDVRSVRESGLQKLCSCWGRGHAVTARPGGPLWSPRYLLSEGSPHRCSAVLGTSGQRMDHRTQSSSERFKETRNVSPLPVHATEVGLHHPAFCHAATLILSQREILVPLANALGDR